MSDYLIILLVTPLLITSCVNLFMTVGIAKLLVKIVESQIEQPVAITRDVNLLNVEQTVPYDQQISVRKNSKGFQILDKE